MNKNELLRSLTNPVMKHRTRVSVLAGTVEGMRTPCRCFRFEPKSKSERRQSQLGEEEQAF